MKKITIILIGLVLGMGQSFSQVKIEGYIHEEGNQGLISDVNVSIISKKDKILMGQTKTDDEGKFVFDGFAMQEYTISASHRLYESIKNDVFTDTLELVNSKLFVKMEMERAPGYIFDLTVAPRRDSPDEIVDAMRDYRIEVYNNTTRSLEMLEESYAEPDFRVNLEKGNHYTMMVRKEGFLAKRMEVYVDVEGCILCFEGIGKVVPGVSDVLTDNNQKGTLLSNIELDPVFKGKKISVQNIYYDLGSAKITAKAEESLAEVVTFMKDNPQLTVELGSHTDSRGSTADNQKLSQRRAAAAMNYLVNKGGVPARNISSKGYGESNLVNHCKDGVKCNEEEHALNRRTELEVLGIEENLEIVPLVELKRLEEMDQMIENISDQGQVRIDENGNIIGSRHQVNQIKKDLEIVDVPVVEQGSRNETVIKESPKSPSEQNASVNADFKNYSGYKIVIDESITEPQSSEMLQTRHSDLTSYYDSANQKYLHMIGDFKDINEATNFLKSIKLQYKKAYVLHLIKGEIIR